ncbi:MAG TPA: hypothetical protein VG406_23955 [Isosphaeraceae bacterium]|jgi:hypothetical protein|nr:hypothetical protein [Isosphaeraceae bacterium]
MRKHPQAAALVAVILASAAWVAVRLGGRRPPPHGGGFPHRSRVDEAGHARGVVQVDLMRSLLERQPRPEAGDDNRTVARVASQEHPLLGRPAPPFVRVDASGRSWSLAEATRKGPVVVVFTLGFT